MRTGSRKALFHILLVFVALSGQVLSPPLAAADENGSDTKGQGTQLAQNEGTLLFFEDSTEEAQRAPQPSAPSPFDFGGMVKAKGASDLSDDQDNEHEHLVRSFGRLWFEWDPQSDRQQGGPGWKSRLYLSVEGDYLWMGDERSQEDFDLDLFENYLFLTRGPFELQIGKQIVRWGKSDQVSPVDNLNPQDLREFIVPDFEDRKLPVWMVRSRWFFDNWTVEGVFLPLFRPADVDYFNSDWGFYQHVKSDVHDAELPSALKDYLLSREVNENEPPDTLKNSEFGGRLTTTVGTWDLGLSFFYGREDLPFFSNFPIKNLQLSDSFSSEALFQALQGTTLADEAIEVDYNRQKIVGFEFETTLGDFGFRGESAFFDEASFLSDDLTSVSKPVLHTVAGLDYSGLSGWYGNLQLSHRYIHNYKDSILYFQRHNTSVLGEVSKEAFRGNVEGYFRFNFDVHDGGYYLEPALIYKGVRNLDISAGLNVFGGDRDTFLGFYDDNDQVYLKVKYYF